MSSLNIKPRWFSNFVTEELPANISGKVFVITGTTTGTYVGMSKGNDSFFSNDMAYLIQHFYMAIIFLMILYLGTGFVAAKTVVQLGGEVVLLNRPSHRVDEMLQRLKQNVPADAKITTIACDLQNFDSIRNAIQEIKTKYDKLFCLCNNAGIMATPDRATIDGYDEQMQTNHLSHFLLTAELFPLLQKHANETGDARIVNHSSEGRNRTANKALERKYLEKNGGNLGGDQVGLFSGPCFERYFQTKLANSVFTYALNDKLQASQNNNKVKVLTAHPGVSATSLSDHLKFGCWTDLVARLIVPMMIQSPEDGTMGLLKGMMAQDARSGVLYGPKGMKGPAVAIDPNPWEIDADAKKLLWETSEAATGVKFDIV
jgi:NAD(P)-dependent dehydrogenase (short-subunit alcohol dehydrogenase family)